MPKTDAGTEPTAVLDRSRGALLGLAAGDALGTTLEFMLPGSFEPITDMIGGGPFQLQPGHWTDDTSMALCLADSLIERKGFDAQDQMERYLRWWRDGVWSSTGHCFDIGNTTRRALVAFEQSGNAFAGPTEPETAGNGSLMRLAPVAIAFADNPTEGVRFAGESSQTTHGAREAVDACRYFASLLIGSIRGASKEELLAPRYAVIPGLWDDAPLVETIDVIASGTFKTNNPPVVRGTGHAVRTLEAALWAFARTDSFRDGALAAVNLGDDADTTGAVYGQLAGAFYGASTIPASWLERLSMAATIQGMADRLFEIGYKDRSVTS